MAAPLSERLSIEGKTLRTKLIVIAGLASLLPSALFFYILFREGIFFKYSIVFVLMLTLTLAGIVILRQIFDRFIMLAEYIKMADEGRAAAIEIEKGAKELYEIITAFNNILERLEAASIELREQTERLKHESVMREIAEISYSECGQRLTAIAENASDAIICLKEPDTIIFWNKKAEDVFGYSTDEAIGREMHKMIVHERSWGKAHEALKGFFKTGERPMLNKITEFSCLHKDGMELFMELSLSAIRIRGEWQAVGIARDITERKIDKERLIQHLDELERFQRAAVQREFRIKELKERVNELEEELKKGKG